MSLSAFDTADSLVGKSRLLIEDGITAVFVYTRDDRTPFGEIQELTKAGLKIFSVYEKGFATQSSYFTEAQGHIDAARFIAWASEVGQPKGTGVFVCVDYDANPSDVSAYLTAFHADVKAAGFLMGLYANGVCCEHFKKAGFAHWTWLTQSTSFDGYADWLPRADVVQGLEPSSWRGLIIDPDEVRESAMTAAW